MLELQKRLLARAVFVVDAADEVRNEPGYAAAIAAARSAAGA